MASVALEVGRYQEDLIFFVDALELVLGPSDFLDARPVLLKDAHVSTAAGICTGAAAQKCTTGSVVACPHSPWEGPARGATRPPRGWRRPARERGVWAHAGKRGVIRTVAGVVTGSA